MVDTSTLLLALSGSASIAVVITAVLVVLQLRQNARLINHAARESRANVALTVLDKLTDESFARRRKNMHDAARLLREKGPTTFDDSLADLEARNFAFIYQIMGVLVREGVIDEDLVVKSLGRLVIADWTQFRPIQDRIAERYQQHSGTWQDFGWLAERAEAHFQRLESESTLPKDSTHPRTA